MMSWSGLASSKLSACGRLVTNVEVLAACQGATRATGRRIGIVTSSGGLAEIILDKADAAALELPPLSTAARDDIVARIGFITGDGNPLDAWGGGQVAQLLQIGSARVMRVEHAHTVGTTQRDICLSADPLDFALQLAPLFALFREAPVVDYRALDPTLRRRDKGPRTRSLPRQNTATSGSSGSSAMIA
jgi:hypothetical protein